MSNAKNSAAAGAPTTPTGSISSAMSAASTSAASTDWTVEAADAIEKAVVAVRRQTVDRAQGISRAIVYGLIALGFALPALTLLIIGAFRFLVAAYAEAGVGSWAAWLTLGGIWIAAGLFAWSKRTPATQ